jgi:hypothetical protein
VGGLLLVARMCVSAAGASTARKRTMVSQQQQHAEKRLAQRARQLCTHSLEQCASAAQDARK